MARIRFSVLVIVLTIVAFLIGCSSGGSNPVTPEKTSGSMDYVPIIGVTDAQSSFNAIGLFGAYELTINSDLTTELTSKRVGAIGEDYIVSGLAFFTIAPCPTCLKMAGVEITPDGNLLLTFIISHPFKKGNTGETPTAINRLDLDVFDLAMVVAPTGGTSVSYSLTSASVYPDVCFGPDGYTTELAEVIPDTAALPYFLVIDDSDTGTSTWNKFEMGTENLAFDVGFKLSGTVMMFDLYLTMGYGFGAKKPNRLAPKYYNPEFNRNAAWKIAVTPPEGVDPPVMGNTWDDNDNAATYDVVVEVYDWQIGATVATAADFADADPTEVYAASEPSGVSVEIPGMNTALNTMTAPDVPSATGMADDPWVFTFAIANQNLLAPGEYAGLVKVTDERAVMTPADGRDFIIDTDDGIELVHYSMPEYATYQIFTATVVLGCGPITGTIDTPTCPIAGINNGQNISFTCSAASDNGGDPIVLYEWDMDYDGSTFDVDGTGPAVSLGPFDNPNCGTPPEDPVDYTVAVRATDSCNPANVTVFATCVVTVDNCEAAPIHSVDFDPMDAGDAYFDVGVGVDSFVYVCANHSATGNVDATRTALQWTNDLATMQVINSGTGMNDPEGLGGGQRWNRIDVTPAGFLVTNPIYTTITSWTVSGATATTNGAGNAISCGGGWTGNLGFCDVWDTTGDGTYGPGGLGWTETTDCGAPNYGGTIIRPDGGTGAFGGLSNPPMYIHSSIVAMDAVNGTGNSMFFIDSGSAAEVSVSGSWIDGGFFTMSESLSFGTYGTGDGEFSGGLDISADSAGNIVVLDEPTSGTFRFQKFDSTGTFIYTSEWADDGDPLRMDFDTGDDELYVITDTGLHRCEVQ